MRNMSGQRLASQVHSPSFVNMLTMRYERSKKLEQALQEYAIEQAPVFSKPVRTRPTRAGQIMNRVWPVRYDETCRKAAWWKRWGWGSFQR
jgi:hypothetical protein